MLNGLSFRLSFLLPGFFHRENSKLTPLAPDRHLFVTGELYHDCLLTPVSDHIQRLDKNRTSELPIVDVPIAFVSSSWVGTLKSLAIMDTHRF